MLRRHQYLMFHLFFFFNDTATTEIYTLSLHDALPISHAVSASPEERVRLAGRRLREAHHFTAVVHIVRDARRPPQRPEVDHAARLGNEEGALGQRPGDPAVPRHLPRSIDGAGLALVPAERAEIEARAFG